MIVVVDASVALKWFFAERTNEPHFDRALAILQGIDDDRLQLIQPPHFFTEVAAVLAREAPSRAANNLQDLWRIKWEVDDSPSVYLLGVELAIRTGHHLFDTLYHATAIRNESSTLITADDRYYAKACGQGRIRRLEDFSIS